MTHLQGDAPTDQPASAPASACIRRPAQVELHEGTSLVDAKAQLDQAGLHPPLLVKPVWTDGREGSHGLAMLHDLQSLEQLLQGGGLYADLQPPLVVQQYVEHGGVMYKVYVLGAQTFVSTRPSLGELHVRPAPGTCQAGVQQLPRISCSSMYRNSGSSDVLGTSSEECRPGSAESFNSGWHEGSLQQQRQGLAADAEPCTTATSYTQHSPSSVDLPPEWLTHALASTLRKRLGLQLFNFDLICPQLAHQSQPGGLYYVVDINYFPGVDKIPGFEQFFVQFLRAAADADAPCACPADSDTDVS